MIIQGKDVIGLDIVTINTGSVIETVDDIAYDPNTHHIIALLVDTGGLFSSAKVIMMSDVRNIGTDAVIVPDESVVHSIKELNDRARSISASNKHLVKTNVLTVDGKELGSVTDIFFDSSTGKVDAMEVSQGGLKTMTEGKKTIKPSDIITIGTDATIVSAFTEINLTKQGERGGLKGALNDAKASVEASVEASKERVAEVSGMAKHTAAELSASLKSTGESAVQTVQGRTQDGKEKIKTTTRRTIHSSDSTDNSTTSQKRHLDEAQNKIVEAIETVAKKRQ